MGLSRLVTATAILSAPALAPGDDRDSPSPNQVKPAQGPSPDAQPNTLQPLGSFPAGEIAPRSPVLAPNGTVAIAPPRGRAATAFARTLGPAVASGDRAELGVHAAEQSPGAALAALFRRLIWSERAAEPGADR